MKHIQVLECTLRDGGLGLEDAYISDRADMSFEKKEINQIVYSLSESCIEIIELGSIEISQEDKTRFGIYQNVESLSEMIPSNRDKSQMFVGLFRGPDTPIDDIPDWRPGLVDGLRVIIRYSELKKSLDFCAALSKKGYKVFVQPMLTMRYTDDELTWIIDEANKMEAYALYFVDSYGYMRRKDIERIFNYYDKRLKKKIRVGFHAHNNIDLAFSNAIYFAELETDRNIIIDSCVMGMGQGSGNLQTELITDYLNKSMGYDYNYEAILNICEIVENFFGTNMWGYSVTRLLSAINKTAYKYAVALRNIYNLSYIEINEILKKIPEELQHRYTKEHTAILVENWSKQKEGI